MTQNSFVLLRGEALSLPNLLVLLVPLALLALLLFLRVSSWRILSPVQQSKKPPLLGLL